MDWRDAALVSAGLIGAAVALVHGLIIQRVLVGPIGRLPPAQASTVVRRLGPPLLQFSTFNWFLGGLALIAAAGFEPQARLATALLVGSSYLFGAAGNLWATRGRHPGWALYGAALILIAYGVGGAG